MKKRLLTIFFVTGLSSFCLLQAQSQFSGWMAAFNTFKTGKKTSLHADVQWRSSDDFKHTQTLLVRPGLNVQLNKNSIVTAGYALIHHYRMIGSTDGYAPEHRIWEQFIYNHKLQKLFMSHRFRLEQRFIAKSIVENNELKNDGHVYANRIRYFIRNVLPLNGQQQFAKGFFAALQNEVFLNIGNKANVNGKTFDQNRLYLAAGYRLCKSFDLEAGYMNQYVNGRNSAFTNNHIVQLAGYIRL